MQHVQGYSGSHWTPASGNYSLCIAPAAARATGIHTTINKYTCKAAILMAMAMRRYVTRCIAQWKRLSFTRSHWTPQLGEYYAPKHNGDMAMMVFFLFFHHQNRRKRSRVNTKNPVFNRGMTYQTKVKGLMKVSI
jgi:hypothetical protein